MAAAPVKAGGQPKHARPEARGERNEPTGEGAEDLSIFFVENPDGTIDSLAGAETIAPPPTNPRLWCYHCSTQLQYPGGASYVQCYLCRTMNAVMQGNQMGFRTMNMLCTVCGTSNLAPWGTSYVRCGHCNTVSDVTHIYANTNASTSSHRSPELVGSASMSRLAHSR